MPAGRSHNRPCLATVLRDIPDKVRDKRGSCSLGLQAGRGCLQPSQRCKQQHEPTLHTVRDSYYSGVKSGTYLTGVSFGKYAAEQP